MINNMSSNMNVIVKGSLSDSLNILCTYQSSTPLIYMYIVAHTFCFP